jgi:hypothetical protein
MKRFLPLIAALALAAPAGEALAKSKKPDYAAEIAALKDQVAALQQQTQAANDYVAVVNLQAAYGYYVDKAQWDDVADLFSKDATIEIAGRGLFRGQDRLRDYFHHLGPLSYGKLFNHMQLQPVVDIAPDGLSAKGRWRSLMQVGELGKEARWGEATYENEYVKQDGVWKITKLHSYITFYVEYDKGWNKGAVPLPKEFKDFPPDEPATVQYDSFPNPFVPPYHYKNPVTGK